MRLLKFLRRPRRRWRAVPMPAQIQGQLAEWAVLDEIHRFETVVPALAGEDGRSLTMPEELAEIIRGYAGADASRPTFTEEFLAHEAPWRRLFEERQEQIRPAIEAALRFAHDVAERGAQAPVVGIDGDEVVVLSDAGMNVTWAQDGERQVRWEDIEANNLPARVLEVTGMPTVPPARTFVDRIAQLRRDATCPVCMTRYSRCYCKEDGRA